MTTARIELRQLTVKSPRLCLRPFRRDDVRAVSAAVLASLPDLLPFMTWAIPNYSIDDSRAFIRRSITWRRMKTAYAFGVFDAASGELLGSNGLHNIKDSNRSAEIGYWIRSDRFGQGLATESSALILRFAFEALNRHRVVLRAATDNRGSNRVAEKLGFHLDGTQRHIDYFPRGWIDLNYYSMLETEYQENRNQILAFAALKRD